MRAPRKLGALILGVAAASTLLSGCGGEQDQSAADDEQPAAPIESARVIFSPREGEVWKYKVQKEIPIELRLSEADAARRPERTESGHLITFERVRTCTGLKQPAGADKMLTTMQISEGGVPRGAELYDLGAEGVISRGWIPEGTPEDEANILEHGVALATPHMQPGQIWESMGRDPGRTFLFRVIEKCTVTVPAGTFDTCRIQITSEQDTSALKRTLWFAENVGIVKEEVVYYGELRVRVRERSELVHWVVPSDEAPADTTVVSTSEGDDPKPDEGESLESEDQTPPEPTEDNEEAGPSEESDQEGASEAPEDTEDGTEDGTEDEDDAEDDPDAEE